MNFKNYWCSKKESINFDGLSLEDTMQEILNNFDSGVEVISSQLDEATLSPIFQMRLSGRIIQVRVPRILIQDLIETFENYDSNFILFLDKKGLHNGKFLVSNKRI